MGEIAGEFDVVVVGAGIIGSCTAYQIAKRGKSVILLEQFDFLHHRGSSHGESRTIRESYPEEYYVSMMNEAFQLWEEAQTEIGYRVYIPTKQLDMGPPQDQSLQSVIASCKKVGVAVEILNTDEVSRRFKVFRIPEDWIGVVTQRAGILRASKAVAMFQALAFKNGAELRDNAEVKQISHGWKLRDGSNGVLVYTDRGSVLGRKCVIAAGAWVQKLVQKVSGICLPIQPLQTSIAYWKIEQDVESFFAGKEGEIFPTFAVYGNPYFYGTPSLEYPGLVKVAIHGGHRCDPDTRAPVPDVDMLRQLVVPWLKDCFGGRVSTDGPVVAEACMYSMSPDEDFILDFLPGIGDHDVVVAAGFSGHGFKMGPLIGRIMADLALQGHTQGVPLQCFSINRFEHNPRGNPKAFQEQVVPCASDSDPDKVQFSE